MNDKKDIRRITVLMSFFIPQQFVCLNKLELWKKTKKVVLETVFQL